MKTTYSCENCSNRIVAKTAGFITRDESRCAMFEIFVEPEDGCTFGDNFGSVDGIIPYDVDLSTTNSYEEY